MPLLRELEAVFLRREERTATWMRRLPDGSDESVTGMREHHIHVESLAEADGVMFLCPKCFAANGGAVGTHRVICWFVGKVPDDIEPKPGRWTPSGTDLSDLTFVPSPGRSNSVLLTSGCKWHGYVERSSAA